MPESSPFHSWSPDAQRAYLAGFMDGDGSIRVHRGPDHHTFVLSVGQNEPEVLELYKERYGGQVAYRRPSGPRRGSYDWRTSGVKGMRALQDLLPFLQVKRGQAELAVWFQSIKSGWHHRPLSLAERAERDSFYLALRDLKREAAVSD